MMFEEALMLMRDGKKVRRPDGPINFIKNGHMMEVRFDKECYLAGLSSCKILADNWEVVE